MGLTKEQRKAAEQADPLIAQMRQLERASRALDPGDGRRKKLRNAAFASAERFLRPLHGARAYVETEDMGAGLLAAPISGDATPLDEVIALFEQHVVRPGGHPASPNHLSYIPGGGLYHSAIGDFLAAVSNKYASVFFSSPGAARMENMLVRWTAGLVGYPESSSGSIASGGSIANLTAIVTARDARGLKSIDYGKAVVYLTSQAHHCIQKALRIAGLADVHVRTIGLDDGFRMRPDALADAITADRAAGLNPWLVVATAGTTDTGAIDPLDAIADIAEREKCWYHIDAAYGGYFLLTEYGRSRLKGIARSDSAVLDPHKSLFMPWGSGIVIVKDAHALAAAHSYTGSYMQDAQHNQEEMSPADISPELTKHFRGVRMWLPLMLVGTKPFTAALDEKLLLARYFAREIAKLGFEVGPAPDLTVVTYRWAPPGMSLERANVVNEALIRETLRDGRIFLSSTMIDGRFTLRLVALSFRTHKRNIDLALRVLSESLARVLAGQPDGQ